MFKLTHKKTPRKICWLILNAFVFYLELWITF